MKRAKYENVVGLVALILKHATSFFHRAKYVDLQIWKDKTFDNLNEISYLRVSWLSSKVKKKKISLYDFGGKLPGKIRTASIVRGIVRD